MPDPTVMPRCARPRRDGLVLALGVTLSTAGTLAGQSPTPAQQVAAAVLPLPLPLRAAAAVVQLGPDGIAHPLRAGSNGIVCLADLPGDSLFDVRCYHREFLPVIVRRRALVHGGLTDSAAVAEVDREVRAGLLLARPWAATAGYRMLGPLSAFDAAGNAAGEGIDRWQSLHLPYATAEQLGVSEREDGIEPYLMSGGTWWAHLMIMERPLRY